MTPHNLPAAPAPGLAPPPSAGALFAAELRAGRRTLATHDALSRAAVCEAQAVDCARDARGCLTLAYRARHAGERRDVVRFAACALTCDRSAAVWQARAAEHLAAYLDAGRRGYAAPAARAA